PAEVLAQVAPTARLPLGAPRARVPGVGRPRPRSLAVRFGRGGLGLRLLVEQGIQAFRLVVLDELPVAAPGGSGAVLAHPAHLTHRSGRVGRGTAAARPWRPVDSATPSSAFTPSGRMKGKW